MESTAFIEAAVEIIGNIGFPIFVSLYLLHRMENKLDDVVKALKELNQAIINTLP